MFPAVLLSSLLSFSSLGPSAAPIGPKGPADGAQPQASDAAAADATADTMTSMVEVQDWLQDLRDARGNSKRNASTASDRLHRHRVEQKIRAESADLRVSTALVDLQGARFSKNGGEKAAEAAHELLSIITEIAIRRAKQRGLAFVHKQITEVVCGLELVGKLAPGEGKPVRAFPATCELLKHTTLDQIAGDPQVLREPLFSDALGAIGSATIGAAFDGQSNAAFKPMIELAGSIVSRSVASRRVVFTSQDARALVARWLRYYLQRTDWSASCGVAVGLEVASGLLEDGNIRRSASELVEAYFPAIACNESGGDAYATALEIATLADRALRLAVSEDAAENAKPDVQQRLRAAVQLGFVVVRLLEAPRTAASEPTTDIEASADTEPSGEAKPRGDAKPAAEPDVGANARDLELRARRLALLEQLLLGAVDQNTAVALSAAVELLLTAVPAEEPNLDGLCVNRKYDRSKASEDLKIEIASLGGSLHPPNAKAKCRKIKRKIRGTYSAPTRRTVRRDAEKVSILLTAIASYAGTYAKAEDATPEQLRATRTEALEAMIDAATVRSNRHGDFVWSLGIPVGFIAGGQLLSGEAKPAGMAPQLSIPFGVAVQMLPGRRFAAGKTENDRLGAGFHVMLTAIDLGQYASYDPDGEINRPRWDSLFAPGAQLGLILGTPEHNFIVGADLRYAPTLFANTGSVNLDGKTAGALRFGGSLSYYVSFFDFS